MKNEYIKYIVLILILFNIKFNYVVSVISQIDPQSKMVLLSILKNIRNLEISYFNEPTKKIPKFLNYQ